MATALHTIVWKQHEAGMKNLLYFVFLALFAALALTDSLQELKEHVKHCVEESKISADERKHLWNMKHDDNLDDITEDMKCISKCVMEQVGSLQDGVVNEEKLAENIKNFPLFKDHPDEADKAIAECKEEKGDSDCDTTFKIFLCFKKHKELLKA